MTYRILSCGFSDMGLVRQNNEDVWAALPDFQFFVLADGMGGHQAGEVAAHEAVSMLSKQVKKIFLDKKTTLSEERDLLRHAIEKVNDAIYQLSLRDDELKGMGTTLCCVKFSQKNAIFAHVGDSRIYRLHQGQLEQITSDHSLLSELLDLGQITENEVPEFLYKNILTKALGTEPTIEPTVGNCPISNGDIFLMCSDGLSDLLSIKEMESIVSLCSSIEEAGKNLISTAKDKGGFDNITVVLMQVQESKK